MITKAETRSDPGLTQGVLGTDEATNNEKEENMDLDKALKDYLNTGGVTCLFCGSDNIEGGSVNISEGGASQSVGCLACDAEWDDLYTLTDVVNINVIAKEVHK